MPTFVPSNYTDFVDVFYKYLATKLPEYTGINNHTIDLFEGQQPPYGPIYSLGLVQLQTLKTYIKTNLVNSFIKVFQSSFNVLILFVKKSNSSFRLYLNYQDFNNLTIYNWYILLLISKSLDWLGYVKHFIHLKLTTAYYYMQICERDKWEIVFKTRYIYIEYQHRKIIPIPNLLSWSEFHSIYLNLS